MYWFLCIIIGVKMFHRLSHISVRSHMTACGEIRHLLPVFSAFHSRFLMYNYIIIKLLVMTSKVVLSNRARPFCLLTSFGYV